MEGTKESMFYDWVQGNIYNFRKHDGALYFVFYIIIPVIVTAWSLYALPDDSVAGAYCYLTILISALNCLYDAVNRWQDERSVINVKLAIMMASVAIVAIYCFAVLVGILVTAAANPEAPSALRADAFFCVYFGTIMIALFDFGCCFVSAFPIRKYTKIEQG